MRLAGRNSAPLVPAFLEGVNRARGQSSSFRGEVTSGASGALLLTPVSLCSIVPYMRMLILSIRLRAEQLQGLENFAKDRHLSVGWSIRAALAAWFITNPNSIS